MTPLDRFIATCKALGIAVPAAMIVLGPATLPTPEKSEDKQTISQNMQQIAADMGEERHLANHVNIHTNREIRGKHTDRHTNVTTHREV